MGDETSPVGDKVRPQREKSAPIGEEAHPQGDETFTPGSNSIPCERRTLPAVRCSIPQGKTAFALFPLYGRQESGRIYKCRCVMPLPLNKIYETFGKFRYTELGGGRIKIDPSWIRGNIVPVELPVLGKVEFHKKGAGALKKVFEEIKAKGLQNKIDINDFRRSGGTFVPRHILWNPKRALSHHSFGIAIDVNVKDNPFGKKPKQDKRLVEIFTRHGFEWGGRWQTPDGMHFEMVKA